MAKLNITIYEDLKEYEKYNNTTSEEFKEELENGYIQTLTLGTYNGASDTFTPMTQTEENIREEVRCYLSETCQGSENKDVDYFIDEGYLFIIKKTSDLYLKY